MPALRHHAALRPRILLAALLIAFGTSDFFEREAWWTPWWLLTWKAASLLGIVVLCVHIARSRRRRNSSPP